MKCSRIPTLLLLLAVSIIAACSGSNTSDNEVATPPAPAMPEHWTIVSDQAFAPADIRPISEKLGGQITALRNTVYAVGTNTVRLNTIVAATPADADAIMDVIGGMKPSEWFVRQELVIYEFVANDAALDDMRAGRTMLLAER